MMVKGESAIIIVNPENSMQTKVFAAQTNGLLNQKLFKIKKDLSFYNNPGACQKASNVRQFITTHIFEDNFGGIKKFDIDKDLLISLF